MSTAASTSLDGYEVWFLTGSQHLYGEEVLKQVAAQSQEIATSSTPIPPSRSRSSGSRSSPIRMPSGAPPWRRTPMIP